ncbi:MAG: TFIIB-type zinc ribbon-containing protein [Oliverpabstia sp.]
MAVISLKCPNCGGELVFDPSTQRYQCPYCMSDFSQQQVDAMQPQDQPSQESETADFAEEKKDETSGQEEAVVYTCPSCGAEIVTDATTAATFCYYCHNPVVLSGRVSGEYLPKWIIPFSIDRNTAENTFLENVRKKKFVPKGFFEKKQIEKLTGVYFPYWMVDWKGQGRFQAKGTKVRVWRSGDTEYTETRYYDIYREGNLQFPELFKNALKKANRKLVEGVLPYQLEKAKAFSVGYLSGFQAEKRDMEQNEFQQEITQDTRQYAQDMLRDSVNGYSTVIPHHMDVRTQEEEWSYVMVPVWVITYKGSNGKMYYYAINGQTGKVCGKLPVNYRKLGAVSAVISAAVFALALVGGLLI